VIRVRLSFQLENKLKKAKANQEQVKY